MKMNSENGAGTLLLLADYKLERWVRSSSPDYSPTSPQDPNWKQLTQYAAYHSINDWYTQPLKYRTFRTLTESFERRLTNKVHKFGSAEFYEDVKRIVVAHLYGALTEGNGADRPLMLFENANVWIQELDFGLSMIIQVLEPAKRSFVIHKYVMEACEAVVELIFHMTVVFCHEAFGMLPERLQVFNMMSGKRHIMLAHDPDVSKSMDYLRLVKDVYLESRICPCCAEELGRGRYVM